MARGEGITSCKSRFAECMRSLKQRSKMAKNVVGIHRIKQTSCIESPQNLSDSFPSITLCQLPCEDTVM